MRERWHDNIVKLRLVDQRGEVRQVRYPSAEKLKRAGVAHPYWFVMRLSSWRDLALVSATILAVVLVIAVIFEILEPLVGFNLINQPKPDLKDVRAGNWGPPQGHLAAVVGTLVLAMVATMKVSNRRVAPRCVRNLLECAKCPWCLYDLSGSVADGDGLTTCPECGGVWEMPERD